MSRDTSLYLEDMLSACRKVREYVKEVMCIHEL
jgi:uncharacterized protein with HEPN domain